MNIASGLAGLSLLGGDISLFSSVSATALESRAVREAKAQFTLPTTVPPWKSGRPTTESAQLAAIRTMATIVDKAETGGRALPADVQTAFTSWKALDRLQTLAEAAAKSGTTGAERAAFQKLFAKGLADLQGFMANAPSDKLDLAFGQPVRRADSVAMVPGTGSFSVSVSGKGVVARRDEILSGLSGTERFRVLLERGSSIDAVVVDLGALPEPPTLDSVAALINQAISAIPYRTVGGDVVLDGEGNPEPKWKVVFEPVKTADGWAMQAKRQGSESVSIDQVDAPAALLVATGQTGIDTPTAARVMRLDDPASAMDRRTLASIAATDTPTGKAVATTSDAIVTDADGFGYVLGTSAGDLGALRAVGEQDLYLTKMDSLGNVVWQRSLGAADSAAGAALSIAPDGDILVAGTVKGAFDGKRSDGDMLVARFDADGDERFAKLVYGYGADRATSIVAGADGSIYLGGQAARGGGNAVVAKLSATGTLLQKQEFDAGGSESVAALALGVDGQLLVLGREGGASSLRFLDPADLATETGRVALGDADARALAVAEDGSIAIGGATLAPLPGVQANGISGGRDGFVARLAGDGSGLAVTYLGTGLSDQVDSLLFAGGALYAGGRTNGVLGSAKSGAVDGFVARLDPATGALAQVSQFGQPTQRTEPVRLALSAGGSSKVAELGFGRGAIIAAPSLKLVSQTSLRAGDSFQMRVDGGALRTVTIGADDTLATLADRVRKIAGQKATVSTPKSGGGALLRIAPKSGIDIEFIAGPDGRDALEKLGLPAARVTGFAPIDKDGPIVRPGGSFGLGLDPTLTIGTRAEAAAALKKISSALSIAQTGYRSLYWDDAKASLVENARTRGGGSTSIQQAQLANYQAALDRLSNSTANLLTGF